MSMHTLTLHLCMEHNYTADYSRKEWQPGLWTFKPEDCAHRIYVGPRIVTVDVPDDFDPTAKVVAALEAEKVAALQDYQAKVAEINERLSKFLAITNEVQA